ncbi:MAG: polyphosphate kinase, partial [Hyphomicrobiaceae bacterium]
MSSKAAKASANKVAKDDAAPAITAAGERYYNRELSWLQFNKRVLAEARDTANPVLERLRFLSIAASNLDEFFMVRAAGLIGQQKAGVGGRSIDGLTPVLQLRRIHAFAAELANDKLTCWRTLRKELKTISIDLIEEDELSDLDITWLRAEFLAKMFAILTPLNIDPAHPFPFIHNKGLTLAVSMKQPRGEQMNGLIPIPPQLPRFVRLPDTHNKGRHRFVSIETVVGLCLDELYPSLEDVRPLGSFRVLRDSDIEYEEEAEDLTIAYEALLRRRRRGDVIRLEVEEKMPAELRR